MENRRLPRATTQLTTQLTTRDGVSLSADLWTGSGDVAGRHGAVVCHPHPDFGGDRHHPVVTACFDALADDGYVTARFDFRPGDASDTATVRDGTAEQLDLVAAIDAVAAHGAGRVVVVGYSFGAIVALSTADPRIAAVAAIAPPLAMLPVVDPPPRPTLVIAPRHDQFTAPDVITASVAHWPSTTVTVLESADHFLAGHAAATATIVGDWLRHSAATQA